MKWFGVLLLCLLTAPFAVGQNTAAVGKALSACGPLNQKFKVKIGLNAPPILPVPDGRARVYVIEEIAGGTPQPFVIPTIRVGEDGHWVGAEHNNSYLAFSTLVGEHHLCVSWQSSQIDLSKPIALHSIAATEGETYYFLALITPVQNPAASFLPYHAISLEQIDPDEGKLLIAQYPYAESNAKKIKP